MNKLRMLCLALVLTLLLPYICYAQDNTDQKAASTADDTSAAPEFDSADDWAIEELTQAYDFGLTTEQSLTAMSSSITREEFCELAVLFYEKYTGSEAAIPGSNPFTDTVNPTVLKAVGLGITNGFTPTSFNPSGFISKQDMAVMIVRAMKAGGIDTSVTTQVDFFTDYYEISEHAISSVETLQERGILKGVTSGTVGGVIKYKLEPLSSIPKQEAIILLKRTFEYACMVRNASKWGPEVYIPKLEVSDNYIVNPEPTIIENDVFCLSIQSNTAYDKNIEARLLEIFKYIEITTGLSFYPKGNEKKVVINQLNGMGHASGGYQGISIYNINLATLDGTYNINNVLLHELLHCIMFRNYDQNFIYNSSMHVFVEGYATFLSSYIEYEYFDAYKAEMNLEYNLYYIDDPFIENNLENYSEELFKQLKPVPLEDPTFQNAYVIGYKFFYYLNEIYGVNIFTKMLDSSKTKTMNTPDEFINEMKKVTSDTLFNDFAEWYKDNKGIFKSNLTVNINGEEKPLYETTSSKSGFYPYIYKKEYNRQNNAVNYGLQYGFIMESDIFEIDYTDAIAITQLNGIDVKGLCIKNWGLKNLSIIGGRFEVFDVNGDMIFSGPTNKLYGSIIEYDGGYVLYGAVKIKIYAHEGYLIRLYDMTEYLPEMFFSQD